VEGGETTGFKEVNDCRRRRGARFRKKVLQAEKRGREDSIIGKGQGKRGEEAMMISVGEGGTIVARDHNVNR